MIVVILKHEVSADSARKSQRIAMRSKRALETLHDVKRRQEQNQGDSIVWTSTAITSSHCQFQHS